LKGQAEQRIFLVPMTSSTTVLAALLKRATLDDHEEVLHAADAALAKKTTPGGGDDDIGALHAKVVALLKLDRYEDALRTLEGQDGHEAGGSRGGGERGAGGAKGGRGGKGGGGGDSSSRREELRKRTPVERAYALYKVGRWDEARALAQQQQQQEQEQQEQQQAFSGARDQRALKHIEAQAVSPKNSLSPFSYYSVLQFIPFDLFPLLLFSIVFIFFKKIF
jgi:hypothetical protein